MKFHKNSKIGISILHVASTYERKASSQAIVLTLEAYARRFQTVYRKKNGSLLLGGAAQSNFAIESVPAEGYMLP